MFYLFTKRGFNFIVAAIAISSPQPKTFLRCGRFAFPPQQLSASIATPLAAAGIRFNRRINLRRRLVS
jgi:hypothetical protein